MLDFDDVQFDVLDADNLNKTYWESSDSLTMVVVLLAVRSGINKHNIINISDLQFYSHNVALHIGIETIRK